MNSTAPRSIAALVTTSLLALPAVPVVQAQEYPDANDARPSVTLDNQGDRNFNQLLGINDAGVIVGYFGDGTVVANNGYILVPKNHYAAENFTHLPAGDSASQTQAIGINNRRFPDIVGFYTDSATNVTHGFLDTNGVQSTIDDPAGSAPNVSAPAQNLLGINDSGKAAGFWMDNNGHEHGFVVELDQRTHSARRFIEIAPATFPGAVATQASDITDRDEVCGFWTDGNNNNHGFFGRLGERWVSFDVRIGGVPAMSTSPFGCNNEGKIVGSFTDSKGAVHGFIYRQGRFTQFDATGSSQAPAFNVMGTLINGVNDEGDIVGFYSDGNRVHGFVRYAGEY